MTEAFSRFLVVVYPRLLCLLLGAWAIAAFPALARLRRRLAARPGTSTLLLALAAVALLLRLAQPGVHRLYYDEFEHIDAARHLSSSAEYAETLAGGLSGWDVTAAPTWPAGHHVALALIFRLFGASDAVAFAWSAVLGGLGAVLVAWAALELFGDPRGALAAGFVWAVLPLGLRWSAAADLTSASLFWCAAALAALHAREAEPGPWADAFAALTLAYAVQVRPENVLLLGYGALVSTRRALLLPAALGFLVPAALALANRAAGLPGYSAQTTAPFANLARQLGPNLRFLAAPGAASLLLALPALAGLRRAPARRLALLAVGYFLVYGIFFRGRFDDGAEDRYALSVLLPLAVAAAAELSRAPQAACVLAAGLLWFGPRPVEPGPPPEARLAAAAANLIPEKTCVLAFNAPAARALLGRPAVWAYLPLENLDGFEKQRSAAGADPRLVLFEDWAWRSRPADAARLEALLARRYSESVLARDGDDALVLLAPR